MSPMPSVLVGLVPLLQMACGLIPRGWADARPRAMRRLTVGLAVGCLAVAAGSAGLLASGSHLDAEFARLGPVGLGIRFDALSAVMLVVVCFVGAVVSAFSVRYLDGDPRQGGFCIRLSFTLGAATGLALAPNLVLFAVAWILASVGLHQLLVHRGERRGARAAARKKFVVSRIGDLLLVSGIVAAYRRFGTVEFDALFAAVREIPSGEFDLLASSAAVLFALGAAVKSAQFPWHTWLPDTMEAPTPVSALMHAGIVNAGGFLVIRLAPLIAQSHAALALLTVVGGTTAVYGAAVAATQTSVKRSLAYSTIAQMGFMLLQCGLGAFSAALLHIAAHSLYKAHAFLGSGGAVAEVARGGPPDLKSPRPLPVPVALLGGGAAVFAAALVGGGTPVLDLILAAALLHLVWTSWRHGGRETAAYGTLAACAVFAAARVGHVVFESLLAGTASHVAVGGSVVQTVAAAVAAAGVLGLLALQWWTASGPAGPRLQTLYVHASNGFYADVLVGRLLSGIRGRTSAAKDS